MSRTERPSVGAVPVRVPRVYGWSGIVIVLLAAFRVSAGSGHEVGATGQRVDPVRAALQGSHDPAIRPHWQRANALEDAGEHLESNVELDVIANLLVDAADPHWRIGRNYYHHSKTLPDSDKDEQLRFLALAVAAADHGLALESDCTQCMLWKYAAMGRMPTLRGLLSGGRDARTLAALLQRGIEVSERGTDARSKATLAQFYYASASFHRMVPDWFWLRWVFGVRGDKERALDHARTAVRLDASRSEYRVELGASLLCLGRSKDEPAHIHEGTEVLRQIDTQVPARKAETSDRQLAGMLLEAPSDACAFSRDGFVDVEPAAAAREP